MVCAKDREMQYTEVNFFFSSTYYMYYGHKFQLISEVLDILKVKVHMPLDSHHTPFYFSALKSIKTSV